MDSFYLSRIAGRQITRHAPAHIAARRYVFPITKSEEKIFGKWYLSSRNLIRGPTLIPLEPVPYYDYRDEDKLNMHFQNEYDIYPGLKLLSEEFQPLED